MRCNRCQLHQLAGHAVEKDLRLTLVNETDEQGGVSVYTHPPGVDITALPPEEREQYFSAWFMAIPPHCAC